MSHQAELRSLIRSLIEAKRELDRLVFDREYSHELGKPSNQEQIALLARMLGKPLPPSYRDFLILHNGWGNFAGGAKILSTDDQQSAWVKKRLQELGYLFQEFEPENPFDKGAIPVLLGRKENSFLVVDPRAARENGEMDFVSYDITKRERTFGSFIEFLQHDLELTESLIDDEKKGTSEDEE